MLSKVRSYRESVSKIQSDIRKRQMEISKDRFSSGARRLDDEEEGESTGKSLSEALIFASTNPQYDYKLFIEVQVQYMKISSSNLGRTCCVQKLFLTFRTIFVHNIFSQCLSAKKELLTKIYLYRGNAQTTSFERG